MVYDISRPLHETMAVFKNQPQKYPVREANTTFAENGTNESTWKINLHTGTHVDAPRHMIEDGLTIDAVDLELYLGICKVFDLTAVDDSIKVADLEPLDIAPGDIVLFKTKNSFDEGFNDQYVFLSTEAAQFLVDSGVRTIGIDAMSIERNQAGHPTHKVVLGAGLGVLEDIRLAEVPAGTYRLHAVPLALQGADGSPVRALLSALD